MKRPPKTRTCIDSTGKKIKSLAQNAKQKLGEN